MEIVTPDVVSRCLLQVIGQIATDCDGEYLRKIGIFIMFISYRIHWCSPVWHKSKMDHINLDSHQFVHSDNWLEPVLVSSMTQSDPAPSMYRHWRISDSILRCRMNNSQVFVRVIRHFVLFEREWYMTWIKDIPDLSEFMIDGIHTKRTINTHLSVFIV